ncbi:hypothetical protein LJC38_00165 [Parabacteroides sp. OttesenSCG-928-K15]|nr:hypothetical protein [Parabacteroides sp. OttesenSCG-928-K15]
MKKVKFGDNKTKISIHKTSVIAIPMAIQFYLEKERFEDAEVFMLSFKVLIAELLIGVRIKSGKNN